LFVPVLVSEPPEEASEALWWAYKMVAYALARARPMRSNVKTVALHKSRGHRMVATAFGISTI
jgi:hypothetical protein